MAFDPWDIGAAVRDWLTDDHEARSAFLGFVERHGHSASHAMDMLTAIMQSGNLSDSMKEDENGEAE